MLFAMLIYMHHAYWRYERVSLVFIGLFALVFMMIESIQLVKHFVGYFTDFWNMVDLIRILLSFIYMIL